MEDRPGLTRETLIGLLSRPRSTSVPFGPLPHRFFAARPVSFFYTCLERVVSICREAEAFIRLTDPIWILTSPSSHAFLAYFRLQYSDRHTLHCLVLQPDNHPSEKRWPAHSGLFFDWDISSIYTAPLAALVLDSCLFCLLSRSSMVILCTRAPCLCHLESSCLHHTLDPLTSVSISCICFFASFVFLVLPTYLSPPSTPPNLRYRPRSYPQCTFSIFSATIGIVTAYHHHRSMRSTARIFVTPQELVSFSRTRSLLGQSRILSDPTYPLTFNVDSILKHSQPHPHPVKRVIPTVFIVPNHPSDVFRRA